MVIDLRPFLARAAIELLAKDWNSNGKPMPFKLCNKGTVATFQGDLNSRWRDEDTTESISEEGATKDPTQEHLEAPNTL